MTPGVTDIGLETRMDEYVSPKFSERHILAEQMLFVQFYSLRMAKYCPCALHAHENSLQKITIVGLALVHLAGVQTK